MSKALLRLRKGLFPTFSNSFINSKLKCWKLVEAQHLMSPRTVLVAMNHRLATESLSECHFFSCLVKV